MSSITSAVAVVIPCFNLGRTLTEALESVQRQSYPASEVIVVDDGSTDLYTRQILARLGDSARLISTANRGPAEARNLGVRLTTAPLIVLLDADDLLEPTYLEQAAALLEARPDLGFVSCALRAFGSASYEWTPPPCTIVETIARGGVHISTMFRRELWQAVGGFDPTLPAYEDTDFWLAALELGFTGEILPEPLVRYRVRADSRYHYALIQDIYQQAKAAIFRKHQESVARHGQALLASLLGFQCELLAHERYLTQEIRRLEQEFVALRSQLESGAEAVRGRGLEPLDWGDLRRAAPLPGEAAGSQPGKTVSRSYIQAFLERHRADLQGRTLQVSDTSHPAEEIEAAPKNSLDAVVLVDALRYEYDPHRALVRWRDALKPGGVLLAAFSCVGRAPQDARDMEADHWRFTEASARALCSELFPPEGLEVTVFGNLMACAAALYGLPPDTLSPQELAFQDPRYPVVVCVRAVKSTAPDSGAANSAEEGRRYRSTAARQLGAERAVILLYHRVASLSPDTHGLCVSPEAFRYQMEHLRRHYVPLALEDLALAAESGRVPRGAVAVTLDDGYLDNYEAASSILSEAGVPATFFVNSERLEQEHEAWWDVVEWLLLSRRPAPDHLSIAVGGGRLEHPTATLEQRTAAFTALHGRLLYLPVEARDAAIDQLRQWSGLDELPVRRTHRLMTADEVYDLSRRPGHVIGAHTAHHLLLPAHPLALQRQEVAENKLHLERALGRPVTAFSYPYGALDWATERAVRDAGFRCAVTVEAGAVGGGANLLRLPRLEVKRGEAGSFEWLLRQWFVA